MFAAELVSVVIPVYNASKFLAAAIRSVQAQGHSRGSKSSSSTMARPTTRAMSRGSFADVRIQRQTNQGIAAGRNAGVRQVRGTLLTFLDADDLWTADKLALQLEMLAALPELSFVSGSVEQFYEPGIARASAADALAKHTGALAGTILLAHSRFPPRRAL